MVGAHMDRVEIRAARLDGVRLDHAELTDAKLDGVDLAGADLTRANLHEAQIVGCSLNAIVATGAQIGRVFCERCSIKEACFRGARMLKARFVDSDLSRSSFELADMSRSTFERVDLRYVNFDGCIGDGARISRASVHGVRSMPSRAALLEWLDFSESADGSDVRATTTS